ncbi:1-acyl-sn-glycerol-3-phosphate acyltransferase [Mesobacterium sp. TK19101]|uniref:1-acyl-sn-glycerol-3-phosphate acyltransferase n=1 Tax=Mesobacterium hydrothermale TaxID=3111907 RepID=A0ABU6HHI4_9RHOB|nr:1-acyl-sn-glycerol-3-phosphate acyltransferase [Mesobacterium sp. TK19101]MEC3861913.1 1-acyl-sn-glycerol-3-phosphate acyltransferase [Mesobacterium sp. TK19101]
MRDRIDPLIADRAPWLFRPEAASRHARRVLDRLLGYERTVALAGKFEHLPARQIMDEMGRLVARRVEAEGLHHIPLHGPALVVCNHPTGIADGVILHHLLAPMRPDLFFFANNDILRVLPQMADLIAPVEWRQDRRSHAKARETMAYTRRAVDKGRLGIIFPSGRLAFRQGLHLNERPWMGSAAMLARKFDLPVIPIHITARNSLMFYLFDRIHPTLRDITLFHETLNKARQPFCIRVGAPIAPDSLPRQSEFATAMLRDTVMALGEPRPKGLRALPRQHRVRA